MKKVILNKCYGGFGVSEEGYRLYAKKLGKELYLYKKNWESYKPKFEKVQNDTSGMSYYFTRDLGDCLDEIDKKDWDENYLYLDRTCREDSALIEVVEELGEKANTMYSNLKIVEIPDNLDYVIDDYDGVETLHEKVREW